MKKPSVYQSPGRKEDVKAMFDNIAGRYDFLNHFLSMGIDKAWRRRLIRLMGEDKPLKILDLATGTADLAIAAMKLNPEKITGTDISDEMLAVGREKVKKLGLEEKITLLKADSENLPFDDHSFDAAMVAYGVRNYENLPKGLSEMHRVLKPGSKAFILEFSRPVLFPVKQLFALYFKYILPLIGRMISKNNSAYTYLPESVKVFPQGEEFKAYLQQAGFTKVSYHSLSLGITMLYIGVKQKE
jgi:demethylmenaquinone methyltransferase/2-methoxy-6-polyprenyl-1,4-benzoquinol methylase